MKLLALGINHETASISLREQLAFTLDTLQPALRDLIAKEEVNEATILSTCNRTEIYCSQQDGDESRILDWFSRRARCGQAKLVDHIYHFPGEKAVAHAFRVASGLDSMVLGEPQILGQMKAAFQLAVDVGATGKLLNHLFQRTFSVAKQVRTDTAIGAHSVSVAYAGVSLARRVFSHLSEQNVLLIGAGETIELVARHLKDNGVSRITIANRSIDKAQKLWQSLEVAGEAIGISEIPNHLPQVDIVVTSTASTLPLLGKGAVERAVRKRKHKPMFILDLAVPRDVEAEVRQLNDVYLYTVDDLKSVVEHHRGLRVHATEQAEIIINLQTARFMRWMYELDALPTVCTLRDKLHLVGQAEANKAMHKIQCGEDPQQVIHELARNLTNRFAHHPSQELKRASADGDHSLLAAAHKLFGL